jgi:hypothetical protein
MKLIHFRLHFSETKTINKPFSTSSKKLQQNHCPNKVNCLPLLLMMVEELVEGMAVGSQLAEKEEAFHSNSPIYLYGLYS